MLGGYGAPMDDFETLYHDGRVTGWRIKTTATHHIDVLAKLVNHRLVTTPLDAPFCYDRHFCYAIPPGGTPMHARLAAIAAAVAWDGAADTESAGWNKNGQTGQWREPKPLPGATGERADYVAASVRNALSRLIAASEPSTASRPASVSA